MKERFDLYSATGVSLDHITELLSQALGIELSLHDSFYLGGGYYLWLGEQQEEVKVLVNAADDEGYLLEPGLPAADILVYASSLADLTYEKLQHLQGLELRRSEII